MLKMVKHIFEFKQISDLEFLALEIRHFQDFV